MQEETIHNNKHNKPPTQQSYKTQHSTVTHYLHPLNNTITKGLNKMDPPARTITVTLDISKAFGTINIHTLIRKLLQTNIPGTIIKLIANYIKGRKSYATYRIHTSIRQCKTGVPHNNLILNPDKTTCTPSLHTLRNIRAFWTSK